MSDVGDVVGNILFDEDVIIKHVKLLACTSILSSNKWGYKLMPNKEISDAIIALLRRRVKDKNTVVRATAHRVVNLTLTLDGTKAMSIPPPLMSQKYRHPHHLPYQ